MAICVKILASASLPCHPNFLWQAFRWIAWKMWDFQESRELDCVFKNKRKTPAKDCNFLQYLILSLFLKMKKLKIQHSEVNCDEN